MSSEDLPLTQEIHQIIRRHLPADPATGLQQLDRIISSPAFLELPFRSRDDAYGYKGIVLDSMDRFGEAYRAFSARLTLPGAEERSPGAHAILIAETMRYAALSHTPISCADISSLPHREKIYGDEETLFHVLRAASFLVGFDCPRVAALAKHVSHLYGIPGPFDKTFLKKVETTHRSRAPRQQQRPDGK